MKEQKEKATNTAAQPEGSRRAAAAPTEPRAYVGPMPPATVSNLPCGCSKPANQLTREEQDFVLATVPHASGWYS